MSVKNEKRIRRHKKIRMRVLGTKDRPRLCVFRSNQHMQASIINDEDAKILFSVSDKDIKIKKGKTKSVLAKEVGAMVAKLALEKKIEAVVFDRGGFMFHGRVKAVAEGAREGGLKF